MTQPASCRSEQRNSGRVVPTLVLDGAEQMALDALLLEGCWRSEQRSPVIRFYQWRRPTLSLGRHLRRIPDRWHQLSRDGHVALVRRPSGGGAVLHAGGLTYALIWPEAPHQRKEAYATLNSCIQRGFQQLGVSLSSGAHPQDAGEVNCFARSTPADLVDEDGSKRIGSAQFWQHGHLLQHGEIPLKPPFSLWRSLFESPPPQWHPEPPSAQMVEQALMSALSQQWPGLAWITRPINAAERADLQTRASLYRLEPSAL